MTIYEPLAILAAVFALAAASSWFKVYQEIERHEADAARVNRRLKLAASTSMIAFGLAGAAVLALPLAEVVVDLLF